jgi:nucleoside-diphosphate-sugar epimerase
MGRKLKILVTGGNGFLGSSLIQRLLNNNHDIMVFSKNTDKLSNVINKCEFISSYTDEFYLYEDKIKIFSPDVVIHFGWWGGNSYKDTNSLNQFYNNLPGSFRFLDFLNTLPKKPKFVGVGTFAEYGDSTTIINEEYIESPLSFYGISKLILKQHSKTFCEKNNIKWVWIRPCFTYGPNDVSTRLIPTLISKFSRNEDVELDECKIIIDLTYIDDFIDFIYPLITIESIEGVYNIASGNQYELKDVINQLHSLIESKSKIIFDPKKNRTTTQNYVCADNIKIVKDTGIISKTSLLEGLKKTINYYEL